MKRIIIIGVLALAACGGSDPKLPAVEQQIQSCIDRHGVPIVTEYFNPNSDQQVTDFHGCAHP